MKSWDALPDSVLRRGGTVSGAFCAAGVFDCRSAARYVRDLAYGRNSDRNESLNVLREARGTCSTKHALLARLAAEQELPINLVIGIYEMNGRNTPGVGEVLVRHGLTAIPEAHCYLIYAGDRVDVTRNVTAAAPIGRFLHEERISPDQIGAYKTAMHLAFIRDWLVYKGVDHALSLDQIWKIREECIAALSE
jgi:hypothetical protein